jgi:hypothetical protein
MEPPDDVVRYVGRSFARIDREEALAALRGAVIHDTTQSRARLVRCAVLSAKRDLGHLIVEGEYVVRDGKLARVLDLGRPIPEDAT